MLFMHIHISTMTWLEPYDSNRQTLVDIYNYAGHHHQYPEFAQFPISEVNTLAFFRNETIVVNNQSINYSVNFSGATVSFGKWHGDNGGIWCGSACRANNRPWPFCKAWWLYCAVGSQSVAGQNGCADMTPQNSLEIFETAPDGGLHYPTRLIDPFGAGMPIADPDGDNPIQNYRYWNNSNLWFNAFNNGMVLIKNTGPAYEDGGEEYLLSVGHPITAQPCERDQSFSFFDSDTEQTITRIFQCPCVAWELPVSGFLCAPPNGTLTQDGYRLWIMKKGQQPIPSSILRHKVLLGTLPTNIMDINKGWPVYDVDCHMRVSKYLVFKKSNGNISAVPDRSLGRTEMISYGGFNQNLWHSPFAGQGDDGHPSFTITQSSNPETIFMGWNSMATKCSSKIQPLDENSAKNLYRKVFDGGPNGFMSITVNQELDPGIFNPTSFSNYDPEDFSTDPATVTGYQLFSSAGSGLSQTQIILKVLDKPQIVFYQFPGLIQQPDDSTLDAISVNSIKFPLKESPYLSRESKNNIFENSNTIAFNRQTMLQAGELNELQEKFYKNQSLTIRGYNKWLTKANLQQNPENIFGTYTRKAIRGVDNFGYSANNIIPLDPMSISIGASPNGTYTITASPDQYRVVSAHKEIINYAETSFQDQIKSNTFINNVDYIHILENKTTSVDLTSMTDTQVCWIIFTIDTGNIITCNEYPELKDNTGGDSTNAPCGASRNLLRIEGSLSNTLILISDIGTTTVISSMNDSPVNNAANATKPPKFILAYAKKENGIVTFYHSNGIKIQ
jgi:hypothetical protein